MKRCFWRGEPPAMLGASLSVRPLSAHLLVGPGPSCHHPSILGIVRGQRPWTPQGTGEPVFSVASGEKEETSFGVAVLGCQHLAESTKMLVSHGALCLGAARASWSVDLRGTVPLCASGTNSAIPGGRASSGQRWQTLVLGCSGALCSLVRHSEAGCP